MRDTARAVAVVLGQPGIVRDVTHDVLDRAEVSVIDLREITDELPIVAVLVDPDAEHWQIAHGLEAEIVVLSEEALTPAALVESLELGASAVLHATASAEDVVDAVATVATEGACLDPAQTRVALEALRQHARLGGRAASVATLTPRERDILRSIQAGHTVAETARHLGIAPKTVENLQAGLFRKLGVRNRAQAVGVAHAARLLG